MGLAGNEGLEACVEKAEVITGAVPSVQTRRTLKELPPTKQSWPTARIYHGLLTA